MSNLINPILLAHYEDNDSYEETSCTLKHWPEMWPEELAAERGLRLERQRQKSVRYFLDVDETRAAHYWTKYNIKCKDTHKKIVKIALVSLADDCGWDEIDFTSLSFRGKPSHKMYRIR